MSLTESSQNKNANDEKTFLINLLEDGDITTKTQKVEDVVNREPRKKEIY